MANNEICEIPCITWEMLDARFFGTVRRAEEALDAARQQDYILAQQLDESDSGAHSPTQTEQAEAKLQEVQWAVDAERSRMLERTKECDGVSCVLAAYCVARTVEEDLKLQPAKAQA